MSDNPIKVVVIRVNTEEELMQLQEFLIPSSLPQKVYVEDLPLDSRAASAFLKITPPTLRKYVKEGSIKGHMIGKCYVIFQSELDRFMREGRLIVK